jgi:hypothetical protein
MSKELTSQEFRSAVLAITDKQEGENIDSLENHLLSLWAVIKKYEKHKPTYSLFANILAEAFDTLPCKFDEQWLNYENDIFWDYQNDSFVLQEYINGEWIITESNVNDFEILKHIILFQISDLHRMNSGQLNHPYRYFGIDSPTGNRWYNFDVVTYWECATAGMEACLDEPDHPRKKSFDTCTWATLAKLLQLGQSYE